MTINLNVKKILFFCHCIGLINFNLKNKQITLVNIEHTSETKPTDASRSEWKMQGS